MKPDAISSSGDSGKNRQVASETAVPEKPVEVSADFVRMANEVFKDNETLFRKLAEN